MLIKKWHHLGLQEEELLGQKVQGFPFLCVKKVNLFKNGGVRYKMARAEWALG